MLKKVFSVIIASVFFILCACSCSQKQDSTDTTSAAQDTDGGLKIVTTIFPAYDFCRRITSGSADVRMLLSPGEEIHSYEPTPQDIISINNADIFVYCGGESDTWVDNILSSANKELTVVSMMDCVEALDEEVMEGMDTDSDSSGSDVSDEEDAYDEHVWTSPLNAVKICEAISSAVCKADSKNAALYSANTEVYVEELEMLDSDFRSVVTSAKRNTLIFADRFPLLYFVKEYGLNYWAAYPGCTSETEANPSTVAFLINKVREESIPVVLKIELSNRNMAESVSEETGADIMTFYSCQTISKDDFEAGETYLSLMRKNLETLKTALN